MRSLFVLIAAFLTVSSIYAVFSPQEKKDQAMQVNDENSIVLSGTMEGNVFLLGSTALGQD